MNPIKDKVYQNVEKLKTLFTVLADCKKPESQPPITGPPPSIIMPKTVCAECLASSSAIFQHRCTQLQRKKRNKSHESLTKYNNPNR